MTANGLTAGRDTGRATGICSPASGRFWDTEVWEYRRSVLWEVWEVWEVWQVWQVRGSLGSLGSLGRTGVVLPERVCNMSVYCTSVIQGGTTGMLLTPLEKWKKPLMAPLEK